MLPLEPVAPSKRIRILSPLEIENLYTLPVLTEEQRIALFELSPKEQALLTLSVSTETKIDAILRLGYFRQKWQFFSFDFNKVIDDVQHILERYFPNDQLQKSRIGRDTKLKNQQWVLENTGYKLFSHTRDIATLQKKAQAVCRTSIHPEHIFRELLNEIDRHKITRPGYSTLQNIVSFALSAEQERISHLFKTHLTSAKF